MNFEALVFFSIHTCSIQELPSPATIILELRTKNSREFHHCAFFSMRNIYTYIYIFGLGSQHNCKKSRMLMTFNGNWEERGIRSRPVAHDHNGTPIFIFCTFCAIISRPKQLPQRFQRVLLHHPFVDPGERVREFFEATEKYILFLCVKTDEYKRPTTKEDANMETYILHSWILLGDQHRNLELLQDNDQNIFLRCTYRSYIYPCYFPVIE